VFGIPIQVDWSLSIAFLLVLLQQLSTLPPEVRAEQALEELGRRNLAQIPVLEGTHLRGIVRQRDLLRWLAFHRRPVHL
jgi:CBS domain-containing protein